MQLSTAERVKELVAQLSVAGDGVAERAAQELRMLAETRPEDLRALRGRLVREALHAEDLRVRWNLIEVLGRVGLAGKDRAIAGDWLWQRLEDASPFNRTFALQALWDLSAEEPALRRRIEGVAQQFAEHGTAAMRARARKLLGTTKVA